MVSPSPRMKSLSENPPPARVLVLAVLAVLRAIGERLRAIMAGQRLRSLASRIFQFGPAFLGVVFLIRLLSLGAYPLVDPFESRYAEMARKAVETQNWLIPQIDYGMPYWGKPPLAVWINALSVSAFGVSEFSVRLSALLLCGGIAWIVYALAATRAEKAQAVAAPALLSGMALFFVMAGTVAVDECLSFGVALAMASFWLAMTTKKSVHGYVFFLGLAIGLLSKGPVTLALTGLPILLWALLRRQWREVWEGLPWVKGGLLMLALSLPWYLIAEHRMPGFLEYFIVGEHWKRFTEPGWQGDRYGGGRAHAKGMIWLYWLLASLPWSPVFLTVVGVALFRRQGRRLLESADGWRLYCLLWMLSPLLLFSFAANLLWTYVLPGLPACALLLWEWRRDGWLAWFSKGKPATALGLVIPAFFLGVAMVWHLTPFPFLRTQQRIVEQYQHLRQGEGENLVYLRGHPFSAQFYTLGKSKRISDMEDLQSILSVEGHDYYVCPRKSWPDLPDAVKSHLQIVGRYDGYLLTRHVAQVRLE